MHLTPSLSADNHCQVALWFHMLSRLFRVQDFLHVFIIIEVRAVRRIMT
jgi:hypothetical protein